MSSRLVIIITILAFFIGCIGVERIGGPRLKEISKEPIVRILIGDEGGTINSDRKIYIQKGSKVYRVSPGEIKLVDGKVYRDNQILLDAAPHVKISFENKRFTFRGLLYRGDLIFKKTLVINTLPLESYLYSVVGCEFNCDEIEAMKAGACAARSYALYHLSSDKDFDLFSTDLDQVYNGMNSETENSRAACDKTRGMVCVYKGKPINAMYSSVCGGKTASAKDVLGRDIPYLKSRSCNYCEISSYYSWSNKYSKENFHELVGERIKSIKGKNPGVIKDVRVKKKDGSGRVKEIAVRTDKGEFLVYGEEIRRLLDLKSRAFEIRTQGNWVYINGKGWGHGVGMCAWGAIGMAKKGKNFRDILKYYYRGINIRRLY